MKLPHFLLFCACISSVSLVLAQGQGRAPREDRGDERSQAPQNDFNRERGERRERFERFEPPRDPREQMNAEERRQLRRDVNDAGREIYRRPDRF
ncbi:MAG: hypothetical protein K2Q19_11515 [Rhodocyclaceae bacterium]|nr:hypothetical protein [Rhodocyclaceae bacterium]